MFNDQLAAKKIKVSVRFDEGLISQFLGGYTFFFAFHIIQTSKDLFIIIMHGAVVFIFNDFGA